jgi:hypothetical protein
VSASVRRTPHDASPEAAIGAILEHGGPVVLDLDETLYLRNSTEDFIDCARPAVLALLLMRFLDLLQPWRWTGGEDTRDVWRVRAIAWCFPWTSRHWRKRVGELAREFSNRPLLAALSQPDKAPIIATIGFRPIVEPLVAALGLPHARIVASRVSFADRRAGKLWLTVGALGDETVRSALVLTDSVQDLALLEACKLPLRTEWPEAARRHALSGVYVPGQYVSRVKRPGTRYIVRGILQEDFALWVLCSIGFASLPLWHLVGLVFLLVSFWSVYEMGYVDNDRAGARYEAEPKLSAAFHEAPVPTPRWLPWIWAALTGLVAIVALRWPLAPSPLDLVAWAGVLLATFSWFVIYNRIDKDTRVWMFAGLQFARAAAFVALVPIGMVGALAIGAHVLAKWVPYCFYRVGSRDWPDAPVHLIRLLFFAVLLVVVGLVAGLTTFVSLTSAAIVAWMLFRARSEIAAAWRRAERLDRRPPS